MPQWSVAEWRARIGGSWLAIGRPFKTKSSLSRGAGWVRRVLTMNQVVTMTIMMIILIGTNLALRAFIVNRGYHCPIVDLLRFGLLSHWNLYLLNSGYLVVIAVSSCSLSLYQFFPSNIKKSLRQFTCDLNQGLQLIFQLILSIMEPLISPLLWLLNFVGNELNWMIAVSVVRISLASDRLSTSEASCSEVEVEVEMSKRGELLRRLALARAVLDIVLSVAVHVIIFKLLMSGDVEKNPGPGELDFNTVDASKPLGKNDLPDVLEEVVSIRSKFYALGRSLRLDTSKLRAIRDEYSSESDLELALEDVLLLWLDKKYDVEEVGPPTWQMLAVAVDKETGGNSHELARRIADRHPAGHHSRHATEANRGGMEQKEKEFLGIDDIREVIDRLWDYRAKWRFIGVELQIKDGDLDAIGEDNRTVEHALREMIKIWLHSTNPRPTRTVLEAALQSKLLVTEAVSTQEAALQSRLLVTEAVVSTQEAALQSRLLVTGDVSSQEAALQSRLLVTGDVSSQEAQGSWCCVDVRRMFRTRRGHAQENDDHAQEINDYVQKINDYAQYLKALYWVKTLASSSDDQWPPPCTDQVFRLAMIKSHVRRGDFRDDAVVREKTISGKVDDVLQRMDLIELEDIFKAKKRWGRGKKVLMEGAPGSGKSTLSFNMCRQWTEGHLFQEYKLVILVKLRETADAKSLAELLPRRNEEVGREIEDTITASDGENVLFILDGWDELPSKAPAYSFILNLVKGIKLPNSSIIITSRPTSSAILQSLVHLQIEILGFTKDELEQYFRKCLQNSVEAAERLLQRIKQNAIIEGTCYLPLNASILVHLFECRGNKLPTTQYGIFTELVCTCIFRHLKKMRQDVNELKSLDELPPDTATQFKHLCKIAYDGVMRDVVIFDLGPNFNTLGLLQGVESLAVCGKSYSYNFLHLSIQELLCAIHMANELDEEEQTEQFKKLFGQPRFMLVFQFFAAKTKLKTSGISEVVTQVAKKCSVGKPSTEDRILLVSLMHCLFEAQDSSLCQLVAGELKQKLTLGTWNSGGIRFNPADCYYLGYFLTFCKGFKVSLPKCSIDDDHCKSLFRKERVYDLHSLDLSFNSIGHKGAMAVAAAMTANLRVLDLGNNSIGPEGAMAVATAMKTAINLRELLLGENSIGPEGAMAVAAAMKTATNLQWLGLTSNSIGNEGAMAVAAAMTDNLQWLGLEDNSITDEGAMAVAAAMKTANLQKLYLQYNAIGEEGKAAIEAAARETGTQI